MSVRLQLFTVPGQVHFGATRKLVLSGADGVVFVADSQAGRAEANRESLDDLDERTSPSTRAGSRTFPHTFHWNKRDLGDLLAVEEMQRRFNQHGAPAIETVATRGDGVFEGLERITRPRAARVRSGAAQGVARRAGPLERARHRGRHPQPRRVAAPHRAASDAPRSRTASSPPRRRRAASRPPSTPGRRAAAEKKPSAPPLQPGDARFTLAEVWPEAERENVRAAEALLAAGDAGNAVLACDLLVTRVLAGAAVLAGTSEAPRDPGVVAMLLGLDGARYLAFRSRVRLARQREAVSMREAYESFAFALEARVARDRI